MIKFPARDPSRININLAALIDIVFLLLIYFLLTSNFIEQDSLDIQLPKVETTGNLSQDHIVIKIDHHGNYFLDDQQVPEKSLDRALASSLLDPRRKRVLVKADSRVVYDRVITVMDLAKKNGARQLMLATEPK
jgi:biopolymer transport protein ExbD